MEEFSVKKRKLKENSDFYKKEFTEDLSDFTGKLERGILTGLVVGGLTFIAYKFLQRTIFREEEKQEKTEPKIQESSFGQIPKILAESAAVFLLNLAKDKLLEYLKERNTQKDEDTSEDQ